MVDNICGNCSRAGAHPIQPGSKIICLEGYGVCSMKTPGCNKFGLLEAEDVRKDVDYSEAFVKSKPGDMGSIL